MRKEAPSGSLTISKQAILKAKASSRGQGRRGKSQAKKESAYYHVSITKLQGAFETQFFAHIQNENQAKMAQVQTDGLSVIKKF